MNEQWMCESECLEDDVEPCDSLILRLSQKLRMPVKLRVAEAKRKIDYWRGLPDKTMQDYMRWLDAAYELEGTHDKDVIDFLKCINIESEDLSVRVLEGFKAAYIRHNSNGQYDSYITHYQYMLDSSFIQLSFQQYLKELLKLLETHSNDRALFGLVLEVLDDKINGVVIKETREVLTEIYARLVGFD